MSRELQALLEALRLEQQEKGSLTVADEIEAMLEYKDRYQGGKTTDSCPVCGN